MSNYYQDLPEGFGPEEQYRLIKLIKLAQNDDYDARDEIIERHLRLIKKIAGYYKKDHVSADDLMADGIIGLNQALDKFDPNSNKPFTPFARAAIENEIKFSDLLFDKMTLPQHAKSLVKKIWKAQYRLQDKSATPEEIVTYLNSNRCLLYTSPSPRD